MSESRAFEWVGSALETRTAMSRTEARGTVRLVLKEAGLDVTTVTSTQMAVAVTKLLPHALSRRGVADPVPLCDKLADDLRAWARTVPATTDTTYAVFERMSSQSGGKKR